MPKLMLAGLVAFAIWCAITLSSIQSATSRIAVDDAKVSATKSAITGTSCATCHGVDSGNMLPIRKSLNAETFSKWVRGNRSFAGFNACPILPAGEITDVQISQIYRILYSK